MRSAQTNRRSRAQRARRDAEGEDLPERGDTLPPHGTVIGRIRIEYHGQVIEAKLLQAGDKARTHGLQFDAEPPELMGLYRAAVTAAAKLARVPGKRSGFWNQP